ncbi:VanZ family protein [Enterococcus sp. BWR-S5]|uniref:VanZ family protein n=1 Tax=Enterococcus sp. BWR-S5 TaxID=2787714 RepID=UPI00192476DD|nr:VanZ family protein [Enterococcus sp. BWR-S5]MBL1227583.1 VanZ family protein [Enterococcus sp. BWR-S5]
MSKSTVQKLAVVLTTIYFLYLFWAIIFKFQLSLYYLPNLQYINLVPFAESSFQSGAFNTFEVLGNLIIFIPFGIYLNLLPAKLSYMKQIILIGTVSLSVELLQYIFSIGVSDITDLITNTLGGVLGILLYLLLKKFSANKLVLHRYLTTLSAIGTAITLIFTNILFVG